MSNFDLLENELYNKQLQTIANLNLPWQELKNKTILITGVSGMIASCLVDLLLYRNINFDDNIKILGISRNSSKALKRFHYCLNNNNFIYIQHDCNKPFPSSIGHIDFAIHAASNTHPLAYSSDPVGTITTNIFGLYNLLEYASKQQLYKILMMSSVEIYGENKTDKESFTEKDLGYIDCNTVRAGYPESKRVCESLCQSYISKYDMPIVIARLCRVFGPTMLDNDSKALAQFIRKAVNGEDIVLKSDGKQYYSYIYVFDAVAALLTIMLKGQNGEAYNISDVKSNITLRDLASTIAKCVGRNVIFELPDEKERKGYSTATKAILDSYKLNNIGWSSPNTIEHNIKECIQILTSK